MGFHHSFSKTFLFFHVGYRTAHYFISSLDNTQTWTMHFSLQVCNSSNQPQEYKSNFNFSINILTSQAPQKFSALRAFLHHMITWNILLFGLQISFTTVEERGGGGEVNFHSTNKPCKEIQKVKMKMVASIHIPAKNRNLTIPRMFYSGTDFVSMNISWKYN